jgi:hypothetical protein
MRRLRKTGAVDQDGSVVTIPRLPTVTNADKPPGWDRWSEAEKVQHLLGLSLDRMHDYLSWPPDGLDAHRLAAQAQAARIVSNTPPPRLLEGVGRVGMHSRSRRSGPGGPADAHNAPRLVPVIRDSRRGLFWGGRQIVPHGLGE